MHFGKVEFLINEIKDLHLIESTKRNLILTVEYE